MILASILLNNDRKIPSPLPKIVGENIDSFRRNHPDIEHVLFDDAMIRSFISANYDNRVLAAYDEFVPYAYKADLARLCIIYKLGGIYSDLSFFVMTRFAPVPGKLRIFRDVGVSSPWGLYAGFFSVEAGHKALKKAIEMICDNVERRYYGQTAVCPAGPVVFGKAVALTCEVQDVLLGQVFQPPQASASSLVDMQNNVLVAITRKQIAGSVESLGITNGNSYTELWASRGIYRSDGDRPKSWDASWIHGRRFTRGTLIGNDVLIEGAQRGVVCWGPYIPLGPGSYEAVILADGSDCAGNFTMDVATDLGERILAQLPIRLAPRADESLRLTLPFKLDAETKMIEFRLHAEDGRHRIVLREVQLTKTGV